MLPVTRSLTVTPGHPGHRLPLPPLPHPTMELRTLGAADLRDAAGREVRAVLQQPKRLALLVFLATALPGRLHRRDSLLALFWPDLDQEHGRAALRRALYFLRQACGPEVFATRGDDEVGIAPDRLWCDALAFDDAIAAGQADAALAVYGGGFLEGFYVQGAPEAEAWMDRERARRRDEAARAAWALAGTAADASASLRWARRAADLAPWDEASLARFLEACASQGEGAAALRLYESFVQRLEAEMGTAPGPALEALARRLGQAVPVAAPVAGEPDPRLVAVCPFVVRGDPSLAYLSEGMVDLLSTKLDGSGAIRTADARTLLGLAAAADGGGVDVERGRALAAQVGAGAFVVGTVIGGAGRLEAGVGLYDTAGRLRARAEARADHEAGLFDLVDELVRRLMMDLSPGAAGRLARLAALTSTSLPALKACLAGEHEFRLGRHLQALDAFRRATLEDGSFALAYYRLASSLAASALIGPAREASADAFRHRDRLSDHDRMLLEAQHAWLHGHTSDAERRYAALTVAFPEHLEPWFLLGDLLIHNNPYRGRSITEARTPLERAVALDPGHVNALTHLARLAAIEGRRADLADLVDRALDRSPAADQALGLRALRAFAMDDTTARREVTAALVRAPGLAIARAFSDVCLYARDWAGAEALAVAILPAARSVEFEAVGQIMLAHLAMARGRRSQAEHLLRLAGRHQPAWALEVRALFATLPFAPAAPDARDRLERELRDWDADAEPGAVALPLAFHDGLHPHLRGFLLGLCRARAGDPAGVATEAEALGELAVPPGAEALVERLVRTLDAEALRLQGRPAEALAALERLRTDVWFQYAVGSPFFAGPMERFLRADLLAEAGRVDEALGWWDTIAQRSPYELVFLAASERRQADVLARRGRLEAARAHEARAAALWTGETS
jgi:DNA-binding SARP family transcriptional activator